MAAAAPIVLWAERADTLFLTVEVADAAGVKAEIGGQRIAFTASSKDGKAYAFELQLAGGVEEAGSKVAVTPRCVALVVQKTTPGPFWGKLTQGKAPHFVKVDWSKYKDEDEEEEPAAGGARAAPGAGTASRD